MVSINIQPNPLHLIPTLHASEKRVGYTTSPKKKQTVVATRVKSTVSPFLRYVNYQIGAAAKTSPLKQRKERSRNSPKKE